MGKVVIGIQQVLSDSDDEDDRVIPESFREKGSSDSAFMPTQKGRRGQAVPDIILIIKGRHTINS